MASMTLLEETAADYATVGLSHQAHPMSFYRPELDRRGVVSSGQLLSLPPRTPIAIAGLVICRQRPGSAKGILFMTLEDEQGMINVVVMPDLFQKNRILLATARALIVHGVLENHQHVVNVLAKSFEALEPRGGLEHHRSHDFR
jgi:error-prone DNA polymerase